MAEDATIIDGLLNLDAQPEDVTDIDAAFFNVATEPAQTADTGLSLEELEAFGQDGEVDEEDIGNLINNTDEVSQLLDNALASINDNTQKSAFSDFEEEDEEFDDVAAIEKRQSLLKIMTLVRIFPDGQPLKVAYIRDGLAKDMEPFKDLIITALTSKFRGKNAEGAYSQALIDSKEAELQGQFKLLEIAPTIEEKENARLFDEKYRGLV